MQDPKDMFALMGTTFEEAYEADRRLSATGKRRNPYICLCGHAMARHYEDPKFGSVSCKPSRIWCHCTRKYPVLKAEDTRGFLRISDGYGQDHAVIRGLSALIKKGKKAEWVPEGLLCHICKTYDADFYTFACLEFNLPDFPKGKLLTKRKETVNDGWGQLIVDYIFCPSCLAKVKATSS